MSLVIGEPQLGIEEAVEGADHEKGRPPDEIYEDDKMKTSSRRFPHASMSKSTEILDLGSEQLGPFASKGKRKDLNPHFPVGFKTENEETGNSKRILQLQRAWAIHSVWASIENVCKISSCVLVNKPQCEHIAAHFKVIGDVLQKLGLGKDFVSVLALEAGNGVQTDLSFDGRCFNHIATTFEDKIFSTRKSYRRRFDFEFGSSHFRTRMQDVSSMFKDYIRELPTMHGSSEDSLSKHSKISERFQNLSLQKMSTKVDVEARFRDQMQHPLDQFLCYLLGVLKQGEDLVSFHSGLQGVNNGVVERTGLHGEKFVEIHELLYKLLKLCARLDDCEDMEFARSYFSQHDSCRAQTLLYYLNSNCLGEYASLSIDDNFLNIELATTLSECLARPNCTLKTLCIKASDWMMGTHYGLLCKCHLMIIAALSMCVSLTSLTVCNMEVHELCKSLRANKVLENLIIRIDAPLKDDHAMDLSAMLKENHSLKSFTLNSNTISYKGTAYFGAMLAENSSLEELCLECSALDEISMKHFMWPLMTDMGGEPHVNLSLKHLHIDITNGCLPGVAEIIAQLLSTNKILSHFSIQVNYLDPGVVCKILDSLKKSKTLQVFDLQGPSHFNNNFEVATCLEAMLAENSTLQELKVRVHMLDKLCLKHLLRPLMANKDGEPHVNRSLKRLHILDYGLYRYIQNWRVESLADIFYTNETLTHFSMTNIFFKTSSVCKILNSLKVNKTLQVLNLDKCQGLDDPQVKVTFLDLLVNYNFTLHTIRMHGRDWDIEAFIKSELELDTIMTEGRLKSLDGSICESPTMHGVYDLQKALEKGEGLGTKIHVSSVSKLEMDSEQSLQELSPSLELVMKSTNFLLRRNLNMAQLLQERYTQWNSFSEMCPSNLTNEEKDELSKGCIIAALFPTTFQYHLKARLLQGLNHGGILHTLKEVVGLVVQRVKSLQGLGSQNFQFIDYVDFQAPFDVQHIYSPQETIAICQTFSTKIGIGEEFQANSIQYGIVQDHLTGAYYFHSDKASNLDEPNIDKSNGVIGVKVTSIEVQIEIMWEDGSYYSGALEDFSYDLQSGNNKQCALEAFGDLEGAQFLKTRGLKCSPLLVIALAMAIQKKGLALTWSNGKGHIQSNSILFSPPPTELEVWECQILFGGDINQLGESVEWGMHQFDRNCTSSSRVCRENQYPVVLEHDGDQNTHISNVFNDTSMDILIFDKCNDTSSYTKGSVDLSAMVAQYNAGAQDKQKFSIGVKVLSSGVDIGFEKKNSKGKKIENQSFKKIQELHWEEKGGYIIGKLNDRHELLEEKLYQGSLYAERDLNYLVVYDGCTASHVSIYWVKEWSDKPRLKLEWVTDIFIKKGPEEIKSIFKGLKGETLEVKRIGTQFLENPSQQQSKGLIKRFINHLSNKGICKDSTLQMVSNFEGHAIFKGRSNDEWEHLVGLQPDICSNDFWWKASYMQAITYSRTKYSSGLLLSTHTTEEYGLKWGSCKRKLTTNGQDYVHKENAIKSCGKFSKAPQSLSSKWHDMIHWGGLKDP